MQYLIANNVKHNEYTLSKLPITSDNTVVIFNCYLLNKLPKWGCKIIWMPRDIVKFGYDKLMAMADYLQPEYTYFCFDRNNEPGTLLIEKLNIKHEVLFAEIEGYEHIPSTGFLAANMFPDAVCVGFEKAPNYDNNLYHKYSWEHQFIKDNRKNIHL